MSQTRAQGLSGLRVALFESRFGGEFENLVRKQGGEPLLGPTLVEAPLALGEELADFVARLRAGEVDVFMALTGVGTRKLVELVAPLIAREDLRDRLAATISVARGPKSVNALRELGVKAQVVAPEPHTWQTMLATLEAHTPLPEKRVALQQYGVPHERLTRALEQRGARVLQVPVYRWQLPEDTSALERVVRALCDGSIEVMLFTAGPQAAVLLQVAARMGVEDALRAALTRVAVGSVGPSCTETLRSLELEPDFEPEHGKMGQLVLEAGRKAPEVLAHKRRGAPLAG